MLLAVIILQAFLIRDLYSRTDDLASEKIKTLIIESVKNVGQEPVTDIATGKDYIPVARLALPSSTDVQVKYNGDKDVVEFSERNNLTQAIAKVQSAESYEATFEHVPSLQACTRQVTLQFTQDNADELKLIQSKTLTDGRTAYIYENEVCNGEPTRLVDYIKQIDSY